MSGTSLSRRVVDRTLRFLSSPALAFWLMLSWMLTYLIWVAPFAVAGQTEATVGAIALQWLPLKIIYVALGITTLACSITRVARDWKRCHRGPSASLARHLSAGVLCSDTTVDVWERHLRDRGYEVTRDGEALAAVRGQYRPLWGTLFHVSLLLVVAALFVHSSSIRSAGIELIEGQSAEEFYASTPPRPDSEFFRARLSDARLISVDPRFYEQYLLFERLDAAIERDGKRRDFSLAKPYWLSPTLYISIQDFNYAPHVVVTSPDDGTVDDVVTSLELFPPGSEDMLEIPSAKIAVVLRVYPDHTTVDGNDASASYNLANPRVQITIFEKVGGVTQQRVLARGTVALGQKLFLPDGTGVEVSEIRKVGTFRLVHAPALPLVLLAGLLCVLGLVGRLAWPRMDIIAHQEGPDVRFDARLDTMGRIAGRQRVLRDLPMDSRSS